MVAIAKGKAIEINQSSDARLPKTASATNATILHPAPSLVNENRPGGEYALNSAIAQPNADALAGGDYALGGGFWSDGRVNCRIY